MLSVSQDRLNNLEDEMIRAGYPSALERTEKENITLIEKSLKDMGISAGSAEAKEVREGLALKIERHETELLKYMGLSREEFDFGGSGNVFEKIAESARRIATATEGFFLKKERAEEILKNRPPENTINYLGYKNVDELLGKEDVGDVMSALRFTESNTWMHETFRSVYSNFGPEDFEKRSIELRVLGSQWKEVAEKYVAKKHHNVSHLKEFGIIFINPIAQTGVGKFLRDFALLLHYFHEISFYSKLFERHIDLDDFAEKFTSLLRGDVLEKQSAEKGEWLVVQRYLWKENPNDPRLFIPRINPEALFWRRAQQDIVEFSRKKDHVDLYFWDDLDFVAGMFSGELVSFEMEDNAMGTVSRHEGKNEVFHYHQREAMWNRIFANYIGGYGKLEEFALENINKGSIRF